MRRRTPALPDGPIMPIVVRGPRALMTEFRIMPLCPTCALGDQPFVVPDGGQTDGST